MKKGIILVANLRSQWYCENLIYSIRESGCTLPIRLIHFGGEKVNSEYILNEVEFLTYEDFSGEAKAFIKNLRSVLTDCPMGFLYRFLAWFSDWDEFIYADNDIVAMMNWERLFDHLEQGFDLVHADEEYTTHGFYNYNKPNEIIETFGDEALNSAITAGHIVVKKSDIMIADMNAAVNWFKEHPSIPKNHDQALIHIASLLGKWKMLNLCKPPYNWLSSWSGDYKNTLDVIHAIQSGGKQKSASYQSWFSSLSDANVIDKQTQQLEYAQISHIHYSGRGVIGAEPIDDFMFSNQSNTNRLKILFKIHLANILGISFYKHQKVRINRYLNRIK